MTDYDVIPYESLPLTDAFPGKLAVLGRLFGIQTADPESCRVLELGCAEGGNLIPLAWYNPNSQFVGIDLSARQIETGLANIGKLGIHNIKLVQANLLDVQQEHGKFDYIIVHGVYTWVPAAVREKLLELVRESLNEHGLAYISYNINPGWRVRGTLRDMLLYHVRGEHEPHTRLKHAYEFIELLRRAMRPGSALERHFKEELNYFQLAHPSYVYHEYLETANMPIQFNEFLAQIEPHDLRYVCDTDIYTMFSSVFDPEVESFLEGVPTLEEQEQYMDFFRVRTLRQSVLCHRGVEPQYEIDLSCLDKLACYAELRPLKPVKLRRQSEDIFVAQEKKLPVSDAMTKATLMQLADVFPDAIAIPELYQRAKAMLHDAQAEKPVVDYAVWQQGLFNLFANNLIGLYPCAKHFPAAMPPPAISPLARLQLATGNMTTIWHQNLTLDTFATRLLQLLDGSRTIEELVSRLKQESDSGKLQLGEHVTLESIRNNCQRLLELFRHHGILGPVPETKQKAG